MSEKGDIDIKIDKLKTDEMEVALARYFNPRQKLVVPRIAWGFSNISHECDLIVLTKSGYLYEVEIKISKQDLIKDIKKNHHHNSEYIKFLYFAIPDYLKDGMDKIPERAGILVVSRNTEHQRSDSKLSYGFNVVIMRKPQLQSKHKLTDEERYQIARLGALKIWGLKEKLLEMEKSPSHLKSDFTS
jgi:hypothetical protein